jgi:trimeric autotransporter adhesin
MSEGCWARTGRIIGSRALRRGLPALMVAAAAAVGAGPAAAAADLGAARAGHGARGLRAGPAGVISTVAGGVGGPARATRVEMLPCGLAFRAGRLYVTDVLAGVRAVSLSSDGLTTPAGAVAAGGPPVGGALATHVGLGGCGVTVDQAGNLVLPVNNRIWVVATASGSFYGKPMTAGHIYPVAGSVRRAGFSGDGGPALNAQLFEPQGTAVDAAGNLLLADTGNNRIRVVAESTGTFYGKPMTSGNIYTVAGGGSGALGDGGPALGASLHEPTSVAVDGPGNLVITDQINQRIRVVAERAGTFYGQAMTKGDIYTVAGDGAEGFAGDGGPAASAELDAPTGVTVDNAGNLVIADENNYRVRVVAASTGTFYATAMTAGNIYTIAGQGATHGSGDGRNATTAQFSPSSVAVDGAGDLMTVDLAGRAWLVAGSTGTLFGRAMTAGHIYNVAGTGQQGFSGDGGPGTSAELNSPTTAAADAAGNIVITDAGNFRVRVVAAHTGTFYGQAMTAGDIYTVAGNGIKGLSGNGGVATSTKLSRPTGVSVDGAGNLVFCDGNRVRVVAVTTGTFYGQAMTAEHLYTVAGIIQFGFSGDGGPATSARLRSPNRTAVDGAGNLLITDTDNVRIRVVAVSTGTFYGRAMTAGDIYTVAGNGQRRFSGDGGPATAATLNFPVGVTVDHAGNVAIADDDNERVRVVAASTGTFYGKVMTAGNIYTVAGTGTPGFTGDSGPATTAQLAQPFGVAVNSTGDLLIADIGNNRIRMVNG